MAARRDRLNLSLRRHSESPKSPKRSSVGESNISTDSGCSTPLNTKKRCSTISDDSLMSYDNECSPVFLLSQDTSNVVSGVSWAWNSPKRTVFIESKHKPKPLMPNNLIVNHEAEYSRVQRKKLTERLKGFNKFQSELRMLQESEMQKQISMNDQIDDSTPIDDLESPVIIAAKPLDEQNLFVVGERTDEKMDDSRNKIMPSKVNSKHQESLSKTAMDSFNESDLDIMLLESIEKQQPTKSLMESTNKTEKRKSFIKSRTMDDVDGISDVSFNDSDFDSLLIEASQMAEGVETTTTCKDNVDHQTTLSTSKKSISLVRHKSMPESPSQKLTSVKHFPAKTSAKSNDHCPANLQRTSKETPQDQELTHKRRCTKEEIELKRQEALKRQQASRLKRLKQTESSQSEQNTTYNMNRYR